MGRSQESFNKKDIRNKKEKKRKEKAQKKQSRKENKKESAQDNMIAYVDEFGMISSTPPDPEKKEVTNLEDIEIGVPKREHEDFDPIRKGIVAYFNDSKGYGFIKDSETKENVFVHINNLVEEVKEGNMVTFEIGSGPKGPVALEVKLYKPE
ncbi:MAG: cold shock domain-containing protein [Bacteroidales bacterium]|nr:cold shock domain-containing protein [Bacteroidales bacterium]